MLLSFVIIGAQKSASTFVHECLREHPDVFMPKDETPFFEDPYYLQSDIGQFEALFDAAGQHKLMGIKRPDYLARMECPGRIREHTPNCKFIVILRNPVERAISAYFWYMRQGYIPIVPLEEGMRNVVGGIYQERYPKSQEIIEYGFYHEHLRRYLRYFDRAQFLIMFQRGFRVDPLGSMRQVYRFLRIDEGYVPKSLKRKPKKTVYSLTRIRWLRLRNPLIHAYQVYDGDMVTLTPKKGVLATLVKGVFFVVDRSLLAPFCENSRPRLSQELRASLFGLYKEDIKGLQDFLGQELSEWKAGVGSTAV